MRVSTRGQYGVRAMLRLGLLSREGQPVPLRLVSEEEGISLQYLEQLFLELKKAGLVRSVRGANGGYILARSPEKISVGEIVRVLEGPIAPVECVLDSGEGICERASGCMTRDIWLRVRDSINSVLDNISLADVVKKKGAGADNQH